MIYRSLWFRIVLLLYLLFCAVPLFAQVQLGVPLVKSQYFDNNGHVLSGGCIFTYISGTNTPLSTYTDFTGVIANPNPVVLSASGRPPNDIWLLGGSAYRIRLVSAGGSNCSSGFQIWSEDGVTVGFASLLASNNVWTGTNTWQNTSTFNGSTIFNVGFTSNGPSNLTNGGSLAGTFTGTPTFAGTLNLPAGFIAGASTFNGQISSTVTTGTAPFVIASTTKVNNLNVDLLDGCDWAIPCALGSTTPNTVKATTLEATTSFKLNGSTPATSVQGNGDLAMLLAGTFTAGAGRALCTDANGGATTAGCAGSSFSQIQGVKLAPGCSTGGGSNSACNDTLTWPTPFADSAYIAVCMGVTPAAFIGQSTTNQNPVPTISAKTATNIVVTTQTSRSLAAQYDEIDCIGIHP
jgi:hypothetical protein